MTTLATTFSKHVRKPAIAYRTYSRPSYMKRFCNYIEYSDWDNKILAHEKLANRICAGVIIASVIFLAPAFVRLFLR